MLAPRLQRRRGQNPAHGGGGDVLHAPRGDELPRQFGAIPLGQATAQRIGAFAGQAYHVERDLRGKNRPWPRGQGRRSAPPDAGRESAWPTDAPPSVERPPRLPRQTGSVPRPGGGESSPGAPARRQWWWNAARAPGCHVLRRTAECVRRTCGRVPSCSPPSKQVGAGQEISARTLTVKQI